MMKRKKDVVFNKKLIKQFHNLVECPATILKRISLLESMESLFMQPIFSMVIWKNWFVVYESSEDFELGMKYFLAIWEIILNSINSVRRFFVFIILGETTK